jgi:hypothetical protein
MYWDNWSLDRVVVLFVSLAFILIGNQVTLYHYRQNLHHKAMWLPVISAPIYFVTGITLTWYNATWLQVLFIAFMWIGAVIGLIGFYFHIRGVRLRVGGWVIRNIMIGPPVILPVVFTAVSGLRLIAMYWKGD